MAGLLPPQVLGPVYVSNSSVTVAGALDGAEVTLFQNGKPLKKAVVVAGGSANIAVQADELILGAMLTAAQSYEGISSEVSRFPQQVIALPDPPPPLAILSQAHLCMDGLLVGGTIKGATVELLYKGKVISMTGGSGTHATLPVQKDEKLSQGEHVSVRQRYGVNGVGVNSPEVRSLPMHEVYLPEPVKDGYSLPAPIIEGPVFACDTAVTIRGIVPGATLEFFNGHQIESYGYQGQNLRIAVPPLEAGTKLHAVQRFVRCGMESLPSAELTVSKATEVRAPVVHEPVCPNAPRVTLSKLRPGAQVVIISRYEKDAHSSEYRYWQATALGETQSFDLPRDLQDGMSGPPQAISAYQENCDGIKSTYAAYVAFTKPGAASLSLGKLTECQRVVRVGTKQPGVTVQLLSGDDGQPIANPETSYDSYVDIELYRPLRDGEVVVAQANGCGDGHLVKTDRQVESLDDLPAPNVDPVLREWMNFVNVDDCIPGARVHVFVNEVWRGSADAAGSTCPVNVGPLRFKESVTAIQALCTQTSPFSLPVEVDKGYMASKQYPRLIVRGPNTQEVTLVALDEDFGFEVKADIYDDQGNKLGETRDLVPVVFPEGLNAPTWILRADHYHDKRVVLNLADKPVARFLPHPERGPAPLTVQFEDQSTGAINSWQWEFEYQNKKAFSRHPKFTFPEQKFGSYKVRLTVSGPTGSDSTVKEVEVYFPDPNTPPPHYVRASKVRLFNQNANYSDDKPNEYQSLTIYLADETAPGGWSKKGDVAFDGHLDVELKEDDHLYRIACVDTDLSGCTGNDPDIEWCVREELLVQGEKDGPILEIVVS
jgi:hypothetical protein